MKASRNHTLAVNGEKLKLLGQIPFETSFDIEGKYQVEVSALVSAKDGCKPNLLGMDFHESTVKSNDLTTPKVDLKTYPEVVVTLSRYQTKSYPYISSYKSVTLDQQLPLTPKSTRVISIRPPNEFSGREPPLQFEVNCKLMEFILTTFSVLEKKKNYQ